jgi:hypothetical protein
MEIPHRFFPELDLITDEAKWFFWLYIEPAQISTFGEVQAALQDSILTVTANNITKLKIDLERIPAQYVPEHYHLLDTWTGIIEIRRGDKILQYINPQETVKGKLLKK